MKKEWETVEIGNRVYAFEQMPAEECYFASLKAVEAFGGVISSAVSLLGIDAGEEAGKLDLKSLLGRIDLSAIEGALSSASAKVDPDKIKAITDSLMPHWFVTERGEENGHRCSYRDFGGEHMADLYKVLGYALRFYFSDFFTGLLSNGKENREVSGA